MIDDSLTVRKKREVECGDIRGAKEEWTETGYLKYGKIQYYPSIRI